MSTDILDALRDLRRALSRAVAAHFEATGVGSKQVGVLRELRRVGSASQVELSRSMATDPAAMMRAIDALEGRGWLQRASCEEDRRRKLISLTPAGRRALEALDPAFEALRGQFNAALTSAERRQFCAIAAKLIGRMAEMGARAPVEEEP